MRAFAAVAISPNLSEVGRGGEGGGTTISHFPEKVRLPLSPALAYLL